MIKLKIGRGGREIVAFGLSAKNIEALKLGMPIHVAGAEMELPFDVLIFYGESEQTMYDELAAAGLIDPERTVIQRTSDKPKPRQ